jgi:hypothetical protein
VGEHALSSKTVACVVVFQDVFAALRDLPISCSGTIMTAWRPAMQYLDALINDTCIDQGGAASFPARFALLNRPCLELSSGLACTSGRHAQPCDSLRACGWHRVIEQRSWVHWHRGIREEPDPVRTLSRSLLLVKSEPTTAYVVYAIASRNKYGEVLNECGEPYAIVHQYDRQMELVRQYLEEYQW